MSYDTSSDPVTRQEFDELNKEHEQLDSMVFDHEDIIGDILSALLDEPSLSEEAKDVIRKAYDKLFNPKK